MNNKNYSSDAPVSSKDQDRFSRWLFSERIAQVIANRTDPSSIIIGLYGVWGDGKTSVLNFIEKSLEADDNVICIKFNPWRFGTEEELLTGFFFTIAEALDTELIKTEDKLKDLVKKVAPGLGSIFGAEGAGNAIGSFISGLGVDELKKRIENELENAKKRVLILVDDVDRLEKTEIHTLFRIVKLTADFKYTAYVLAFDKDIVAASLQERYPNTIQNAGEAFLEKIIQIPLHLPVVEKQALRELCFHGINNAIDLAGINLTRQQEQEFISNFYHAFDDCLTTPRKAKLYGNILLFVLPILKDEVNPVDLMLVEGIRVFFPLLYEVLRVNRHLFTGVWSNNPYTNHEKEKEYIKNIIDTAFNAENNINKEGLINLLKNLFPKLQAVYGNMYYTSESYAQWNNGQRICSEGYFSRYFTYSISRDDFPDKLIFELVSSCGNWTSPFSENENPLKDILNPDNAEQLIKKFRQKANNIGEAPSYSLAVAISQKSSSFPNPDIFYNWTTPFCQAAMLISNLIQNINIGNRLGLACECIDVAPSIEFKLEIFRWLKKEEEDKPEKDAFPNSSIDIIGQHLGESIVSRLSTGDDITLIAPKSIPYIFYILNKFVKNNFINDYITAQLSKDYTILVRVLDSYVPTAWIMDSGLPPHKSDFGRKQYNSLAEELDASIIMKSIKEHFPHLLDTTDDFPTADNEQEEKDLLFVKQFIWLHNRVLEELQSNS